MDDGNLLRFRGRISKDGKGPGCNRLEAFHGRDDKQAHARNPMDVSHARRNTGIAGMMGTGADP